MDLIIYFGESNREEDITLPKVHRKIHWKGKG